MAAEASMKGRLVESTVKEAGGWQTLRSDRLKILRVPLTRNELWGELSEWSATDENGSAI